MPLGTIQFSSNSLQVNDLQMSCFYITPCCCIQIVYRKALTCSMPVNFSCKFLELLQYKCCITGKIAASACLVPGAKFFRLFLIDQNAPIPGTRAYIKCLCCIVCVICWKLCNYVLFFKFLASQSEEL